MKNIFHKYAKSFICGSLIVTSAFSSGCARYGNFHSPDKIEGVVARLMEEQGVSVGCGCARRQLFYPADSSENSAVNKRIFEKYFASGLCAPKGDTNLISENASRTMDSAWNDPENSVFSRGKTQQKGTKKVTRGDVMRDDFMGKEASPNLMPASNIYDVNTHGYLESQGVKKINTRKLNRKDF